MKEAKTDADLKVFADDLAIIADNIKELRDEMEAHGNITVDLDFSTAYRHLQWIKVWSAGLEQDRQRSQTRQHAQATRNVRERAKASSKGKRSG